jgi:plastocyanin
MAGAGLLLATACGRSVHIGASRTLDVAVTEYRLNPSQARVPAGTLTINVHNYGLLSHNLVVSQGGRLDGATAAIPPGQSAQLLLDLSAGTYTMSSTILSGGALGQTGTLHVG